MIHRIRHRIRSFHLRLLLVAFSLPQISDLGVTVRTYLQIWASQCPGLYVASQLVDLKFFDGDQSLEEDSIPNS
jgi:hypothetical protein